METQFFAIVFYQHVEGTRKHRLEQEAQTCFGGKAVDGGLNLVFSGDLTANCPS